MREGSFTAAPGIHIPAAEFSWSFTRSAGPGGQNVNKLATAAELRWDVMQSPSLPYAVRERLVTLAGSRLTTEGVLVIKAQRHRTQERNRADALERLLELVRRAAVPPKPRKKTKPTKGSKRRRLDGKRRHSDKKRLRSSGYE
jgi:ribosome-associated protein